jgi:hypothetical protein
MGSTTKAYLGRERDYDYSIWVVGLQQAEFCPMRNILFIL